MPPTVADILAATAAWYGIEVLDLRSRRRAHAHARHVAMYVARKLTTKSYAEIGRAIGDRDHTTIMNGVIRVHNRLIDDGDGVGVSVDGIIRQLATGVARAGKVQAADPAAQVAPC